MRRGEQGRGIGEAGARGREGRKPGMGRRGRGMHPHIRGIRDTARPCNFSSASM
jgi:hypothetical protein